MSLQSLETPRAFGIKISAYIFLLGASTVLGMMVTFLPAGGVRPEQSTMLIGGGIAAVIGFFFLMPFGLSPWRIHMEHIGPDSYLVDAEGGVMRSFTKKTWVSFGTLAKYRSLQYTLLTPRHINAQVIWTFPGIPVRRIRFSVNTRTGDTLKQLKRLYEKGFYRSPEDVVQQWLWQFLVAHEANFEQTLKLGGSISRPMLIQIVGRHFSRMSNEALIVYRVSTEEA